ncbi:histidine kinase, partial [Streptomyces sp. SID14478]|uniref:ATP-binding protein n=1 Tax=Streptomyces sp. SID14478 TaxID=2706073 RepID=UPI00141096B0
GPGGRGLGLALVRQAVHRNGGTLEMTRPPGGGAEFTVTLPLEEGAATLPALPAPRTPDEVPTTIQDGPA